MRLEMDDVPEWTDRRAAGGWLRAARRPGTWLLLVWLLPAVARAQLVSAERPFGRYQQFVWQDQPGLAQESIRAMTRTRDGYLWLATYAGVARFDGVRFTAFDPGRTPQFASGLVDTLLEDHQGRLWFGTDGDGLVRYVDGRFTSYTIRDGLSNNHVMALAEDDAGSLWMGTDGGGIMRLTNGRFVRDPVGSALADAHVFALTMDAGGALWVGTGAGLVRCTRDQPDAHCTTFTTRDGLSDDIVRSLSWDREHRLWIGTGRGVSCFADGQFTTYGPLEGLTSPAINVVYHDREGTLWVGAIGGLYRFHEGRFQRYARHEGLPTEGLMSVLSIFQDPEGDLWLGTDAGGLVQFREPRFRAFTPNEGLAGWSPIAVAADAGGTLWVGTESGLSRFAAGTFVTDPRATPFADAGLRAIAVDRAGAIWVGTRRGVLRLSASGGLTHWTTANGLPHDNVFAILPDRHGDVWIGTMGGGLCVLRDKHFTTYTTRDGLPDNDVVRLFEDRAGTLWIGTRSGGISRFDHGHFTNWSTRDGLGHNMVLAFYEDREGHLWIGTHGGGLTRFANGRLRTVTSRDGLAANLVYHILDDGHGNLWMSSGQGIYRASLQELNDFVEGRIAAVSSFSYGVGDGMLNRDCSGGFPGGATLPDGTLWFPTARGLVSVDPSRQNTRPPLVAIETVTIDRQVAPSGAPVRLQPGQRDLEIGYTALSWSRARHVKFKYRLAGLDANWIDAGGGRTAHYSRLPAGTYTFTVIADNGDGVWNLEGRSVTVTVVPAFYERTGFVVALVLSVVALVAIAWRVRVRTFERAQAAQQAFARELIASQERERQRIAAELHDSLGQHLLVIRTHAMLHAMDPPPATAVDQAFVEIGDLVSETLDEVRTISWNLRPSHLDQLGLRTALIVMTEKMSIGGRLTITHAIDPCDGLLSHEQEILVYRIVQESLTNVVKHSHATEASVTVRQDDNALAIEVRDNGRGFLMHSPHAKRESGFGLTGIAERVRMLGGTHVVHSGPGEGSVVAVTLGLDGSVPVGMRHG